MESNSPGGLCGTPYIVALPLRRFRPKRYKPGNLGTWSGHLAFAHDLVATMRPSVLVELGTHYGQSYFGFCQSVEENHLDCRCCAVDTWLGDEHAGFYGESVYREVSDYNKAQYSRFSQLLRTTFDEASGQFADGSVDLLHIDGLHTFEAVKHDFEQWLPKVRAGGIVLIHDIDARHANFEVWRLWADLKKQYRTFEFNHCWGLGILQKPGDDDSAGILAKILFNSSEDETRSIRDQYKMAAELMEVQERPESSPPSVPLGPLVQVFAASEDGGFSEQGSVWNPVEAGSWQHHILKLPQGFRTGTLRLDVINFPALIDLAGITIRRTADQRVIFQLSKRKEISALPCNSELIALPEGPGPNFFSTGFDPHLVIPAQELAGIHEAITVELWMLVNLDLSGLTPLLRQLPEAQRDLAAARLEAMRAEMQVHHAERLVLHGEIRQLATVRDTLSAQNQQLRHDLEIEQNQRDKIEAEAADAQRDFKHLTWDSNNRQHQLEREQLELKLRAEGLENQLSDAKRLNHESDRLRQEHQQEWLELKARAESVEKHLVEFRADRDLARILLRDEERRRDDILNSYSWKITGPMRGILGMFRPATKGKPKLP